MHCSCQRQPVTHRIGAPSSNGANVSGLDFGASAAIDDMQPRKCARLFICGLNRSSEGCFPEGTHYDHFDSRALERHRFVLKIRTANAFRMRDLIGLEQCRDKSGFQDQIVFVIRQRSDGSPERSLVGAAIVSPKGGFIVVAAFFKGGLRGIEWVVLGCEVRESWGFPGDCGFRRGLGFGIGEG